MDMVDEKFFLSNQFVQIEPERSYIGGKFFYCFLECQKNAGLVVLKRSPYQKFHGEQGLSTTCISANQGWPSFWQSAECYFIEPLDAGRRFFKDDWLNLFFCLIHESLFFNSVFFKSFTFVYMNFIIILEV